MATLQAVGGPTPTIPCSPFATLPISNDTTTSLGQCASSFRRDHATVSASITHIAGISTGFG